VVVKGRYGYGLFRIMRVFDVVGHAEPVRAAV
jgi:hypothetical protein